MSRLRVYLLVAACLLLADALAAEEFRRTVAAGPLYPFEIETLTATLNRLFDAADPPPATGRIVACIAPHSGYGLSGEVAAHAFKNLKRGAYDRVIVLAPSHFMELPDCSIAATKAYATPLGFVFLDGPAIELLARSPVISTRGLRYKESDFLSVHQRKPLHEREYAIEVILPFLQMKLGQFALVPILIGNKLMGDARLNARRLDAIAENIAKIVDDRTLIVVSTEFTHFGDEYGFRPLFEEPASSIAALDLQAFRLILDRNLAGFRSYLAQTKNPICGRGALQVLLQLIPKHARGNLLAHQLSMELTQAEDYSVSYAALSFQVPARGAPARGGADEAAEAPEGEQ